MYLQQWRTHSVQVYKSVACPLWLNRLRYPVVHMYFLNGNDSRCTTRMSSRVMASNV